MSLVVIVTAADGTKYAYGPTTSVARAATAAGNAEDESTYAEVINLLPLSELLSSD